MALGLNTRRRSFFKTAAAGTAAFAMAFLLSIGTISVQGQTDQGLIIYPAPAGAPQNASYGIQVRKEGGAWQNLFSYDAIVGRSSVHSTYAYFDADFSSKIEVRVTRNSGTVSSVRVRPVSAGITVLTSGNTVSFFLNKPRKLSIEFNGDLYNNVHLFANPIEVNPPKQGDPGLTYYGPGITNAGAITVSSNQTIYIAGGAIVQGHITASGASNIKILGRGILDNSVLKYNRNIIRISNSSNVTMDGIFIIGSLQWTVVPQDCDHITINNIKILNSPIYSDGIDPVGCQTMMVNDCFIRNGDDCMSIKAKGAEANSDITIQNSIFWSDGAHGILIGPEANGSTTQRIIFENNDILEVNCGAGADWWGAMAITNSGDQTIRDITFKDVRVDNFTLSELLNIRIETNQYVATPGKCVKNIKYINISYDGVNKYSNLIKGYDATRYVDSVYFENLRVNGQLILNAQQANLTIQPFVYNVIFASGSSGTRMPLDMQSPAHRSRSYGSLFTVGSSLMTSLRVPGSTTILEAFSSQGKRLINYRMEERGNAGDCNAVRVMTPAEMLYVKFVDE